MAVFVSELIVIYNPDGTIASGFYDTVTVSNNISGNTFVEDNPITITTNTTDPYSGTFEGTTIIEGLLFVVCIVTDGHGNHVYAVVGPSVPDPLTFPTVANLVVDGEPFTVCFLAGTRIATPAGETPVEELAIGDLVLTADGRVAPVRWIGTQTVVAFFADRLRSFPVRIAADALGEGLPVRDLLVSPDHALMLDGALVQAGALVNGTTIGREADMPERFTYFHVELEDHALILAEGVPAETFVDNVTRRRFDNYAEFQALYGDAPADDLAIAEMAAPRVKSARQLPQALRRRIAARAAASLDALATVA